LPGRFPFPRAFAHREIFAGCRQRDRRETTFRQCAANLLQGFHNLRRGNLRGLERARDAQHQEVLKRVLALAARDRRRDEAGMTQLPNERWWETEQSL
jgi:hypothetical protein